MLEYELRLPANGSMVKIATLKPVSAHGFPDLELPRRFLDVGTDFKKGRDMKQVIETSMPLEFSCQNPSEILELEAYLKHLENGDGQRGKAAEVCNMERGGQLHVAPQRPVHRDSSFFVQLLFAPPPSAPSPKRSRIEPPRLPPDEAPAARRDAPWPNDARESRPAYHDRGPPPPPLDERRDMARQSRPPPTEEKHGFVRNERPFQDDRSRQESGFPVHVNGILPGFEAQVERMLDEYGEVLNFYIPKSARDKCASGDFRMLYGIATFRNKLHAEDAIRGMTDRFVGAPAEQRKLKLRWDRTADAAPDTNPIPAAKRTRPWEQRENPSYAARPPMSAPDNGGGGWNGDHVVPPRGGGGGGGDWPHPEPGSDRQDNCSVFVRNLLFKYQEDEVGDFFADKCGPVKRVNLKRDAEGKSRGFGFVEFVAQSSRDKALATLNGASLGGRELTVKEVEPRDRRGPPRGDDFRPPRPDQRFFDRPPAGGYGGWDERGRSPNGGGAPPGRQRSDDRPLPY